MTVALSVCRRARRLLDSLNGYLHSQGQSAATHRVGQGRGRPAARIREVERLLARHRRYVRRRDRHAEARARPRCQARFAPTRRSCASTARRARGSPTTPATRRRRTSSATTSPTWRTTAARTPTFSSSASAAAATSSPRSSSTRSRSPASRSTRTSSTITNGVYGDFTGHLDRIPASRSLTTRPGATSHGTDRKLRHHPDLAHRHLGGDLGGRLRAERELALHDRRVEDLPRPPQARRRSLGLPLVRAVRTGRSRSRPTARRRSPRRP